MNGLSSTTPYGVTPIALFVYNRPQHTQKTLDSLARNDLASRSDLFIFSDASRSESGGREVHEVRSLIKRTRGFRSITITERDKNLGLAQSVIAGVTEVCGKFGRAIVMEDDLLTSCDFLSFMNQALDRYASEPRVFSVSGFNFAVTLPDSYGYDAFSSYRSSSWGWGTWFDRWQKADWEVTGYETFREDRQSRRLFNRGGEDLAHMLDMQMNGQIDSWAIRWAYTHFRREGVAILSTNARVYNIGLDGSGVHSRAGSFKQSKLNSAAIAGYRFPDSLEPVPRIAAEISRACRSPLPRRWIRYLLTRIGSRPEVRGKSIAAQAPDAKRTPEGGH